MTGQARSLEQTVPLRIHSTAWCHVEGFVFLHTCSQQTSMWGENRKKYSKAIPITLIRGFPGLFGETYMRNSFMFPSLEPKTGRRCVYFPTGGTVIMSDQCQVRQGTRRVLIGTVDNHVHVEAVPCACSYSAQSECVRATT